MEIDLSIIIVNYNTVDLLDKALKSIEEFSPNYSYEVFVVDNASNDGSKEFLAAHLEKFEGLKIILNDNNIGFAGANNIAIRQASGRYILLLNPDTEVLEGSLDKCINFMDLQENKEIGILGCKVLLKSGELDLACRRGFPNLKNSFFKFSGLSKAFPKVKAFTGYNLTYLDQNQSYSVDSVVGAFMMLRREVIDEIGLLDEEFFMYGEDIDWCYRAKRSGWDVYYYAGASIIHHKRASSVKSKKALNEFYRAMEIFYRKHYANEHGRIVNKCVYSAIKLLATVMITINYVKTMLLRDDSLKVDNKK